MSSINVLFMRFSYPSLGKRTMKTGAYKTDADVFLLLDGLSSTELIFWILQEMILQRAPNSVEI